MFQTCLFIFRVISRGVEANLATLDIFGPGRVDKLYFSFSSKPQWAPFLRRLGLFIGMKNYNRDRGASD